MQITIDLSVKEMTDIVVNAMRSALLEPTPKAEGAKKETVERLKEALGVK